MNVRTAWRGAIVLGLTVAVTGLTGCGHWSWRHHDDEVEYDHDGDHEYKQHHPEHPLGGPPGQMKKHHNGNDGPDVNINIHH